MNNIFNWVSCIVLLIPAYLMGQKHDTTYYTNAIDSTVTLPKVKHAEPLYIDLIRDLGARKGEKEWNVGFGVADHNNYNAYEALVEYEWAPIDRLGLEVELPFTFYQPESKAYINSTPKNQLQGLKLAAQWTFSVDTTHQMSMALGYINELITPPFQSEYNSLFIGNSYNPFLVVAKRWGADFHSLVYTGPVVEQSFQSDQWHFAYEINTSFHYMVPNTHNFVGIEINQQIADGHLNTVLRPQMRLSISETTMLGIVTGIPLDTSYERFSTFFRLIWEPHF